MTLTIKITKRLWYSIGTWEPVDYLWDRGFRVGVVSRMFGIPILRYDKQP
jgi:hypothetical protein